MERPDRLMARFERGEIDRKTLHAGMASHARELIREMEEDRENPAAAWWERLQAGRLAHSLVKRHGVKLVRECLIALSELDDFPPAARLWNASHPDVPIHCYMRIRRPPTFRIVAIHEDSASRIRCRTEHRLDGKPSSAPIRSTWEMERDVHWHLRVVRKSA